MHASQQMPKIMRMKTLFPSFLSAKKLGKLSKLHGQLAEIRIEKTKKKNKMRLVFCALLLTSLISVGTRVHGQEQTTNEPNVQSWPGAIFSRISRDLSDDWADETTRLS